MPSGDRGTIPATSVTQRALRRRLSCSGHHFPIFASCPCSIAVNSRGIRMKSFLEALKTQRWDEPRFYHHSRINQSLHLVSALSFLAAYFTIFTNPVASALIAWLGGELSPQAGHFIFEPKGYAAVNEAPHEHKEDIQVGYNLKRKIILLSLWALPPLLLWLDPTLLGVFSPPVGAAQFLRHVGQLWLVLGLGALLFRTVQLFFQQDVQTGLVWLTKIITDPFHDIMLYYRAPLYLLRGELIDPMEEVSQRA